VFAYVLVAIFKKRLGVEASLHEILQVLSLNLFEKVPVYTGAWSRRLPRKIRNNFQPVESARLVAGR
jgi:hypothetical protein